MPSKSVYIETSIPSAYVDERRNLTSEFQRAQTRLWWVRHRPSFNVYCSEMVLAELEQGRFPGQEEAIDLVARLPFLPITEKVIGAAKVFQHHLVMPRTDLRDAVHLAVACVHEVDYLLTWNCRHLANPNKVEHIQTICLRVGLLAPVILTPQMLVESDS